MKIEPYGDILVAFFHGKSKEFIKSDHGYSQAFKWGWNEAVKLGSI